MQRRELDGGCALVFEYCLWARFALVSCGPGALRVGVRTRPMGKGVLLRGPGAQRALRALVFGYGSWARIALVSPWFWYSVRVALIGVRIQPMGKDCAFFSVVLVLSAVQLIMVMVSPCGAFSRAVYTDTRPGGSPAIRAGKGWRGRRGLAPRCSATQSGACIVGAYGETHVVHKVRTTTTTTKRFTQGNTHCRPRSEALAASHDGWTRLGCGVSGGCEVLGGTSSSASPWLWQLRHTKVPGRTPRYGDRSQAPEPKRGKSARSTKPYGDTRDFSRGCGQHFSSRCSRRGM